jgi:hypothetical protein
LYIWDEDEDQEEAEIFASPLTIEDNRSSSQSAVLKIFYAELDQKTEEWVVFPEDWVEATFDFATGKITYGSSSGYMKEAYAPIPDAQETKNFDKKFDAKNMAQIFVKHFVMGYIADIENHTHQEQPESVEHETVERPNDKSKQDAEQEEVREDHTTNSTGNLGNTPNIKALRSGESLNRIDNIKGSFEHEGSYYYLIEEDIFEEKRFKLKVRKLMGEGANKMATDIYSTVIKVNNELPQNGNLSVQIFYSIFKGGYAWQSFPSSYLESVFDFKTGKAIYKTQGSNLAQKERAVDPNKSVDQFDVTKFTGEQAVQAAIQHYIMAFASTFRQ